MVGRVDRLDASPALDHWKAKGLDLSAIVHRTEPAEHIRQMCVPRGLFKEAEENPDSDLIQKAAPALESRTPVSLDINITNVQRTLGTRLSHEIARRYGEQGLPEETIVINAAGSAGQSFCAFGARGITLRVKGDANDYFGKGLSGAVLAIQPPEDAAFVAEENIIIGNVAFYGATSGRAYIRGRAGERFCVRNSGARVVVEGVGDHGCEYMTGGCVVVLGSTGRNFAAGMSGGVAYVLDREKGRFSQDDCNRESVDLDPLTGPDEAELRDLIQAHRDYTGSAVAAQVLDAWPTMKGLFIKVMPKEYKMALVRMAREEEQA
jgi:glutamate synthase domain-containing protein 3